MSAVINYKHLPFHKLAFRINGKATTLRITKKKLQVATNGCEWLLAGIDNMDTCAAAAGTDGPQVVSGTNAARAGVQSAPKETVELLTTEGRR
eukprot:6204612-Pleurochrysis_carterae.AAC.1